MSDFDTVLDLGQYVTLFGYGLVFFVMGWSIALQSRRYSRLELAFSLKWLAGFGMTHGLHEWGNLLTPIQSSYLSQPVVRALYLVQLVLLGVSFSFLLEFGMDLLHRMGRVKRLNGLSVGLLIGWLFIIFFILLPVMPDLAGWHNTANALARFFIGFPAGVLSAIGLHRQINRRIVPMNVPHIVRTLRIASLALFSYAVLAEFIPLPLGFFSENTLNVATYSQAVSLYQHSFGLLTGLILAIAIIRALEVFELETERMIESMQQQQMLNAERERIGRELHDGAIQKVYTAGLLIQSVARQAHSNNRFKSRLDEAEEVLEDAILDLRNSLVELRESPSRNTLHEDLRFLENDPRFHSLFDIALEVDDIGEVSFSSRRATHVLAIVNEALSNVARHANAKNVKITATSKAGRLVLSIQDDGRGLPPDLWAGYGLRNMRDRARLLGGKIDINRANGKGTVVILDVPWKDER